ncbi:MAG: type II CAAX endopeptidase family protein [Synechococcales cyanobacterium]
MVSLPEAGQKNLWNLATGLAVLLAAYLLLLSWFQPPPQTQLDLFQTNLTLQALRTVDHPEYQPLAGTLLGKDTVKAATSRYQEVIGQIQRRLNAQESGQVALDGLQIRLGLLLAQDQQDTAALVVWQQVTSPTWQPLAQTLVGLWNRPIRLLPEAEEQIRQSLDGWFEAVALQRLLSLQQRGDALNSLNQQQDQVALQALVRLALASGIPILAALIGLIIGSVWGGWMLWKHHTLVGKAWSVPWPWTSIQQLITLWFFAFLLTGQLVPTLYRRALGIPISQWNSWQQAVGLFLTYNAAVMAGLWLIYRLGRRFYPLAKEAWRVKLWDSWLLWSVAGYFVAVPLVIMASLVSQLVFSGSGGGNPILSLILNSQGWGPRILFLVVVSVCAPIFEELLFRGVILTTLTRDRPVWQAVGLSALLFAVAHLNLADVLPLTTLGIVLGVVYTHSRNLLAPITLHGLWNLGSFVALLVLGGQ